MDLFEKYESAIKNGCDKNCDMCDLWLYDREECIIEANRKWQEWADKRHMEFDEFLKETT